MLRERGDLNALATQAHADIRNLIKGDSKVREGKGKEAVLSLLKLVAPATLGGFLAWVKVGEVGLWVAYDGLAYYNASVGIEKLNGLAVTDLGTLRRLQCLADRHLLDRYNVRVKLAQLKYGPAYN